MCTDAKLLNFRHCQVCWTGAVCPYTAAIITLEYSAPSLLFCAYLPEGCSIKTQYKLLNCSVFIESLDATAPQEPTEERIRLITIKKQRECQGQRKA